MNISQSRPALWTRPFSGSSQTAAATLGPSAPRPPHTTPGQTAPPQSSQDSRQDTNATAAGARKVPRRLDI